MWKYKRPSTKRSKQHSEWDKRWRKCFRSRNCWRRTWSQPVNEGRPEEASAGRHQEDKSHVRKMVRGHQGGGETAEQQGRHSTVHRFCEATASEVHAVLRHAPADLRGGTLLQHPSVLVATVAYQENPQLCLQILNAAMFQVF